MRRAVTKNGVFGELEQLNSALAANDADLAHLQPSRLRLGSLIAQAREADVQQAAFAASKQGASKNLRTTLAEAKRLANVLRLALKAHYGIRSEKLAEFDVQPFRGRQVTDDLPVTTPTVE
jgi:hypothetical protein